ncbi:MAG: hypothetical protein GY714_03830 [Desulfobacterales bacterium]|nr:hypothetical protein [Desulfobacterales bacterium]MCP4161175.1 hypothetical protein [Deltaproteobacteria bacterium]
MDSSLYQTLFILALIGCPAAYYSWKSFLKQSIPIGIVFSLTLVLIAFSLLKINTFESLMYSVPIICFSVGFLITIVIMSIYKAVKTYDEIKESNELQEEKYRLHQKEREIKAPQEMEKLKQDLSERITGKKPASKDYKDNYPDTYKDLF